MGPAYCGEAAFVVKGFSWGRTVHFPPVVDGCIRGPDVPKEIGDPAGYLHPRVSYIVIMWVVPVSVTRHTEDPAPGFSIVRPTTFTQSHG